MSLFNKVLSKLHLKYLELELVVSETSVMLSSLGLMKTQLKAIWCVHTISEFIDRHVSFSIL